MASIHNARPDELNEQLAEELKKVSEIKPPDWAGYVKTGRSRERPPVRHDWWYIRAAAILRWVKVRGPVGVSKLRTKFGGKKNRGVRPDKFFKSSGNIIRKALQQLEAAGLVSKKEDELRKGRVISPKGMSLLEKTAKRLAEKSGDESIWGSQKPGIKKDERAGEQKSHQKATKEESKPKEKAPQEAKNNKEKKG